MAFITCGQLFRTSIGSPLLQTLRYRTRKPNLRRPAIPHWQRAVTLEVTKPKYKDPLTDVHPADICKKRAKFLQDKIEQVNPFEQILAREFLEKIEEAKVIAIFHRNSMTVAELYAVRLQLSRIGLYYQHYNNNIAKLAFTGTKYEALLQLYQSQTATFTGDEVSVTKFLKMQKKIRSLVLLAGVVEGRLMSVNDLQHFAALPSLPVLHSQLVGLLNTPLQQLSQNLSYHQTELSSSLSRYISDQTSETANEASPETSSEELETS